jgi:Gpi18-like mannosyltransferase
MIGFVVTKLRFGNIRKLIAMWAIVIAGIWITAWLVGNFCTLPRTPVETLSTWDGEHYDAIARNGYSTQGWEWRNLAFFPLLPSIARLFGGRQAPALAGILVSQLCLLGSVLLIGHIARENEEAALYEEPGFWLLVSPVAFFLSVFYSESLFLFLTLLMVAAYRKNLFGTACVVGILAGLTRPTAVCLPALFIVDVVSRLKRGDDWRSMTPTLACLCAPLLGVLLYVGYVGYLRGTPFAYYQIQAGWEPSTPAPFLPLIQEVRDLSFTLSEVNIGKIHGWLIIRLFSSFSILALMIWGWKRSDPSFLTYLITSMLFIHALARESTARNELVLFPVFILLSQVMKGRPRLALIAAGVSLALQIVLFVRYANRLWVA